METAYPFPKNFLIKKEKDIKANLLSKKDIEIILKQGLDLQRVRNYIPDSINLMLNNYCIVDCEYCYANKSEKVTKPLRFSRVQEIIAEAASLGLRDVEVGGGEFFLYPHWAELIDELRKYDYKPYISTKYPLTEDIVNLLVKKDIKSIQLSIDSVNNDELKKMLNTDGNYLQQVMKGVELLNEAKIEMTVKPVITKYNDSIDSVKNLLDYLNPYKNIKQITLAPGSYSIYKPFNFSSTVEKISKIKEYIDENKQQYHFDIKTQGANTDMLLEQKQQAFTTRSLCSGNMTGFYVLPDGKVTLCEQIYWHPFFILGDLTTQSIMEVWNGEKALALWNFSQEEVREESPCKQCDEFDLCRRGKGNCWRIAIGAYGIENYDYPAPNCPKSLPVTRPFFTPDK
jgi:radical SAM protein with 4Fe4S-binding SPASM domain